MLNEIGQQGTLDLVAYNVGNNAMIPSLEIREAQFETMWRQNALGGFLVGREAVRRMLPKGSGTILYTGATASLRARPPFLAFASAKAALRAVAQGLAREFGPQGIHVAHVVIDGVIGGDYARNKFPDSLQPRATTDCWRRTRLPTPTGLCTASRAAPGRMSSTSGLSGSPSKSTLMPHCTHTRPSLVP